MQHIFTNKDIGEGLVGYILPTCSCGWVGKKEPNYGNYQFSNLRDQKAKHIKEEGVEEMTVEKKKQINYGKVKVYLVVGAVNTPGRVYAVFADEESAGDFIRHYHDDECEIEERTLLY